MSKFIIHPVYFNFYHNSVWKPKHPILPFQCGDRVCWLPADAWNAALQTGISAGGNGFHFFIDYHSNCCCEAMAIGIWLLKAYFFIYPQQKEVNRFRSGWLVSSAQKNNAHQQERGRGLKKNKMKK